MNKTRKEMTSKAHILFVDDEQQFSAMTREYLEAKGFDVTLKHNAEEGMSSFKTNNYDLCIFDVKMPVKDGFSLAEEVRALDENIPIVFLTGQTQKEDRIKGLTIGADDYITKPFSMEELFLRIKGITSIHQYLSMACARCALALPGCTLEPTPSPPHL